MARLAIWAAVICAIAAPLALAAASPLLAWRQPVYILAGFAGIVALGTMLVQPLLAAGWLPGLRYMTSRRVHRWIGALLVLFVVIHVGALWITSPPDVIDAVFLVSPTPFSDWGVLAMWAIFTAALLAALRNPLGLKPATWRIGHTVAVIVSVAASILHAMLVDGTMETVSKSVLCVLVLAATGAAVVRLRAWTILRRRQT